jgi:hypothetical protein
MRFYLKENSMRYLSVVIIILVYSVSLIAIAVQPEGAGTETDPYLIANLDNLQWISENQTSWGSWCLQTADIDASVTSTWNDGNGWSTIGQYDNSFSGEYNGQGHVITGLYCHRIGISGMFGYVNEGVVRDLYLVDANITGTTFTGAIVGYLSEGCVYNCSAAGSVSGDGNIGGLVGSSTVSSISRCYSTCQVNSTETNAGGLVGINMSGLICDCFTIRGSVNGTYATGGLVGTNMTNTSSGVVRDCYAAEPVSGGFQTGGLVGRSLEGIVTDSFWDTETSEQGASAGGVGCTALQMHDNNLFLDAGWDFVDESGNGTENTWTIFPGINNSYPYLSEQCALLLPTLTITSPASGEDIHELPVSIAFMVPGVELGDDAAIELRINNEPAGYYTSSPIPITSVAEGGCQVRLSLVDANHDLSYPVVRDTVTFYYHLAANVDLNQADPGVLTVFGSMANPSGRPGVAYALGHKGQVDIAVYDLRGRLVKRLANEYQSAGAHRKVWDGTDSTGRAVSSGIYLCRITTRGVTGTQKWILMK